MYAEPRTRLIAFHLPQFHPIPENDEWWGKGFTEWRNVTKARPLFEGHYQPHLPADLGFYDLRLPESRAAQAALAREYGIYGFCYYHYWFSGRRILERPVNEIVASGQPDIPFCLCWANENWTRSWDGRSGSMLLEQVYSPEDDVRHIQTLIPIFKDPRYIKVDGKPFFLVYRLSLLPDPAATIARWRDEVRRAGFPDLYLANVESFPDDHGAAESLPLDAAVEFAPDWKCVPPRMKPPARLFPFGSNGGKAWTTNRIVDYKALAERMQGKPPTNYLRYRCVTPMWDNAARRATDALIFHGSTPDAYRDWLAQTISSFNPPSRQENFVFINAWNEWAEGSHLEPDLKWGRAYLEATRSASQTSGNAAHQPGKAPSDND
jgi:lipopolysaccharide biosynthesis protein